MKDTLDLPVSPVAHYLQTLPVWFEKYKLISTIKSNKTMVGFRS